MRKLPLWLFFCVSLLSFLLQTATLPSVFLYPFAPLLILSFYRLPLLSCLYISLGIGLLSDLCSSQFFFGLYTLSYTLTTWILYRQKRHFFEEKPSAFCLYTALFSFVLSLCPLLASLRTFTWSLPTICLETILMPLCDALYAYSAYYLLSIVLRFLQQRLQQHPTEEDL